MILTRQADIVLPELDEPVCCTNRFSDKGSEKQPTEDWQRHQEIADLIGITPTD